MAYCFKMKASMTSEVTTELKKDILLNGPHLVSLPKAPEVYMTLILGAISHYF